MAKTFAVIYRRSRSGCYLYVRLFNEGSENVTKQYARPGAKWVESCGALRVHTKMDMPLLFNVSDLTVLE